jgi:hypothetical protein
VVKLGEPKEDSVKATLRIDPTCRLGEHHLRLRAATGVSEIRTFWVGALTNIAEVEANNEAAKAQLIPMNSTVVGTIPGDDVDYFQVKAERGARLSVEIEAMRLDAVYLILTSASSTSRVRCWLRWKTARCFIKTLPFHGHPGIRHVCDPSARNFIRRPRRLSLSPARRHVSQTDGRLSGWRPSRDKAQGQVHQRLGRG